MSANKLFGLAALGLMSVIALTGCNESDSPFAPKTKGYIMTVHASPDAPGVDLLVDGGIAGSNLMFPNNTGYLTVKAGTRNLKVNVAGTTTTVINANLPVTVGASYSVFAVDAVANIAPLVLTDDLTKPAAGKAHVRFVHLSPTAPAVDVAVAGGPVLFANRSFKLGRVFCSSAACSNFPGIPMSGCAGFTW